MIILRALALAPSAIISNNNNNNNNKPLKNMLRSPTFILCMGAFLTTQSACRGDNVAQLASKSSILVLVLEKIDR
jgi:hypothetical protein